MIERSIKLRDHLRHLGWRASIPAPTNDISVVRVIVEEDEYTQAMLTHELHLSPIKNDFITIYSDKKVNVALFKRVIKKFNIRTGKLKCYSPHKEGSYSLSRADKKVYKRLLRDVHRFFTPNALDFILRL